MLALYDKTLHPPNSLCSFTTLYSEMALAPLALQPTTSEEEVIMFIWIFLRYILFQFSGCGSLELHLLEVWFVEEVDR